MVRFAAFALVAALGVVPALADDGSSLPYSPKPTMRVAPVYPSAAGAGNLTADTLVAITVVEGGDVSGVDVLSEAPAGYGFGAAAANAVRQWKFATAAPGTYKLAVKFVAK